MAKLGYTWFTKDWRSNMNVSKLSLEERGFYRELIDECYIQSSPKIVINRKVFTRLHQLNSRSFSRLLAKLNESLLIVCPNFDQSLKEVEIVIPSISKRLGKINNEKEPEKDNIKTSENQSPKHKEKDKVKEKEIYRKFKHLSLSLEDFKKLEIDYTKQQIDYILNSIENYAKNKNYTSLYLTALKWLQKEYPKGKHETKFVSEISKWTSY